MKSSMITMTRMQTTISTTDDPGGADRPDGVCSLVEHRLGAHLMVRPFA